MGNVVKGEDPLSLRHIFARKGRILLKGAHFIIVVIFSLERGGNLKGEILLNDGQSIFVFLFFFFIVSVNNFLSVYVIFSIIGGYLYAFNLIRQIYFIRLYPFDSVFTIKYSI